MIKIKTIFVSLMFLSSLNLFAASNISIADHHFRCSEINSRWRCENTDHCRWSYRRDMCVERDGGGGGGGGGHHPRCYEIQSPRECNYQRGCHWNWDHHQCERGR